MGGDDGEVEARSHGGTDVCRQCQRDRAALRDNGNNGVHEKGEEAREGEHKRRKACACDGRWTRLAMVKNGWLQRSGQSSWGGIMGVGRSGCSVAHGHRTDRGPRRGGGKAADCAEEEEEEEEEARGVGRVQAQGNGDARRTRKKGPVCWMGEGDGVVWVRVASLTTGGTGWMSWVVGMEDGLGPRSVGPSLTVA